MLKKEIKHVPKFDRQEFNFWKRPILMSPQSRFLFKQNSDSHNDFFISHMIHFFKLAVGKLFGLDYEKCCLQNIHTLN